MTLSAAPTPNQMPGAQQAAGGAQPATPAAGTQQPPAAAAQPAAQPAAPPAQPVTPAAGAQPPAAPAPAAEVPPWEASGEPFDPALAWSLVTNLRAEKADLQGKLTDAQPILDEHERLRRASQTELDTTREDLTKATAREATWRTEAVRSKAEAIAASAKFIDAGDAVTMIGDLSGFVDGDTIDIAKLTERIGQLATDKPYLVAGTAAPGFTPNRGQGQSGNAPLTSSQVAAQAESQQDWKAANSAKAQQLVELRTQQK